MKDILPRLRKYWSKPLPIFIVLLILLLVDRVLSLTHFGFRYTDIDQLVLWNGAIDYSKGIFHEPFFYGQPYNYMLESFLAVPLLWLNIPIYLALPLLTCFLAIVPYLLLALFFWWYKYPTWGLISLALPLLLPLEYNFLTSLSRGNVQAHVFIPFLFFALFHPENNRNILLFFLASGISIIANTSSLLFVLPAAVYIWMFHLRNKRFYLYALLVFPFLALDYWAKYYYKINPEKVLHEQSGMYLDGQTFIQSFSHLKHFEFLFPGQSNLGWIYLFVLILFIYLNFKWKKGKALLYNSSQLLLILMTFSVPKIQTEYLNAGIFFTPSRLYLFLPLCMLWAFFLTFKNKINKDYLPFSLLILCCFSFAYKQHNIDQTVNKVIEGTSFPISEIKSLKERVKNLDAVIDDHQVDLVITNNTLGLNYTQDGYAFHGLSEYKSKGDTKCIVVNQTGDRRTWLYDEAEDAKCVLLHLYSLDSLQLKKVKHAQIHPIQFLIYPGDDNVSNTLKKLNLSFGIADE